ncbi:hypothetical protein ACWM35_20925 [Neobacillus sp. K501]
MKIRKVALMVVCSLFLSILAACGGTKELKVETEGGVSDGASGIVLAGQKAPEIVGIIENIEADEVMVTVDGQDVQYRLSDKAKEQLDAKEVEIGSTVTFTTFSIGDNKETIDEFVIN